MKYIILNFGLILSSFLIVSWYLSYIKNRYGKKSSISASAKELHKYSGAFLFYVFILLGITFPLMYVANTLITTIGGILIAGIGVITGYNPDIKNSKLENFLHVVLVNLAIVLFYVGICIMNPWLIIPCVISLIPIIKLFVKKPQYHTWDIEVIIIYTIWVCLIIGQIFIIVKLYD